MRKRSRILFLVGLVAVVCAALLLIPGQPEPVYQGRRLSEWFRTRDGNREECEEAVRQIGTNAIPTLLRMLQAKDAFLKKAFVALAEKQDLFKIEFEDAYDRSLHAVEGFRILGDHAKGAVPELIELCRRNTSADFQENAFMALGNIGPGARAAVPFLVGALASTNGVVRASAAEALWGIRSDPELVVPALTNVLNDPLQSVRCAAVGGLACFGTNAQPAIPYLLKMAVDGNPTVRSDVMDALRLTRGNPELVVPVLTNALADTNEFVRARAAFALSAFGTNSQPAVPALLNLAGETNNTVRDLAIVALGAIGSSPDSIVPVLTRALSDPEAWIRANAAEGLGNFGRSARSAVPALVDLYLLETKRGPSHESNQPDTVGIVINALKQIDPDTAAKAGIK